MRTGWGETFRSSKVKPNHLDIFSEQNLSGRISSQLHFEHRFQQGGLLTLRNSVSYFERNITIPDYVFQGQQLASYSEATWTKEADNTDWIIGGNLITDDFTEGVNQAATQPRNYSYLTAGLFAQNNWNISKKTILESGFRADYDTNFGLFPLPRVSLLIKPTRALTLRMGGGMGYKLPTIFNEESEALSFHGVAPLDRNNIKPENSIGANFDVNYKTIMGDKLTFSLNQLFFYTQLVNSLVLDPDSTATIFSFANATGPVDSRGFETNIKFTLGDLKLFQQYAYTDVLLKYDNINKQKPFTPKHNFSTTLMYEQEHKWLIGYEVYYIGQQFRSDY